jgi:hypothetical protein
MTAQMNEQASRLVGAVASSTAASPNEENLRHEIEKALEQSCAALGIAWTPFQLERALHARRGGSTRFTDVAHGAVLIEYEPPYSFRGGRANARIAHAKEQAEEYVKLLAEEEGRSLGEYVVIAWDGAHLSFGRHSPDGFAWEPLGPFDEGVALRLLELLQRDGVPLVHPRLLSQRVGPDSSLGAALLPRFYRAIQSATRRGAPTTKTKLFFAEWRRLFGQVVGLDVQSERLKTLLAAQGRAHGQRYDSDPAAYLYALNTYIALVAKLVAAMALPNPSGDIADDNVPVAVRIDALESGDLFADAGILNMLNGDFFAWYRDDQAWDTYAKDIAAVIRTLRAISFDVTRKTPESTRDLFKGLYMSFVPRALRHSLGEYYTPDWLAAHALDQVRWKSTQELLDPTAGSGTFILEALKRRLAANPKASAADLISGLWGLDLNPLDGMG